MGKEELKHSSLKIIGGIRVQKKNHLEKTQSVTTGFAHSCDSYCNCDTNFTDLLYNTRHT
jgi:hypothetical protein